MELFGKKSFPRKDLTTFTGPAKSGKTFWTSILMACCAKTADSERKVLELQRIREEPLKVMWYDTKQSKLTTKNILANRIFKMTDAGDQEADLNQLFCVFLPRTCGDVACSDQGLQTRYRHHRRYCRPAARHQRWSEGYRTD